MAPGSCLCSRRGKQAVDADLMIAFMCARMGLRGIADTTGRRNSNRIHELRNGFVAREDHLYRARARCALRVPITTRADHQMITPQRDKATMQHGSAATARERWSWVAKPGDRWVAPTLLVSRPRPRCRSMRRGGLRGATEDGCFFKFRATQCHFVPRFGGPTKIRKPI